MYHVIEPNFGEWNLFFSLVNQGEKEATIRYCPRPKNGGDKVKGFEFSVPFTWLWNDFYSFIKSEEFIKTFWIESRFGDALEKMWWRILDFFQPIFDDCPHDKTWGNDFCKRSLPIDLAEVLTLNGIDLDRNYW